MNIKTITGFTLLAGMTTYATLLSYQNHQYIEQIQQQGLAISQNDMAACIIQLLESQKIQLITGTDTLKLESATQETTFNPSREYR